MTQINHLTGIEFFSFENELWYKNSSGDCKRLQESDRDLIKFMIEKISEFYPGAYEALCEIYKGSQPNIRYFQYRIVKRFAACNFGNIDPQADITLKGEFCFEHVACPLRGECIHENKLCHPKFNSQISDAELRVLRPLFFGNEREEVAQALHLSLHTVNNHIRNAFTRIGIKKSAEFIAYAHKHKLFDEE